MIGTAAVAQAKPDGYTLLHGAAVSLTVLPLTEMQAGYTAQIVRADLPDLQERPGDRGAPGHLQNLADLMAASQSQARRPELRHPGTAHDPASRDDRVRADRKVEFNHVPFKGPAEAVQMTHAGQIDFAAVPLSAAATSGLRMPGLFAPTRNPSIPAVPTMKEQGFDIAPLSFGALVAPAGLPAEIKAKLADGCRAAAHADAYARVARSAFQPDDYYGDSAMLARNLDQDVAEKRRLLAALGISK